MYERLRLCARPITELATVSGSAHSGIFAQPEPAIFARIDRHFRQNRACAISKPARFAISATFARMAVVRDRHFRQNRLCGGGGRGPAGARRVGGPGPGKCDNPSTRPTSPTPPTDIKPGNPANARLPAQCATQARKNPRKKKAVCIFGEKNQPGQNHHLQNHTF